MKQLPTQEEIDRLYLATREKPNRDDEKAWTAPFPYNLIHLKDKLRSAATQ